MPYEIEVRTIEPQRVAVIRTRAEGSALSRVVPALCGEVWDYARNAAAERPGRLVALYWDGTDELAVGVEIAAPIAESERVRCSLLPGGTVAATIHIGPYSELGRAHAAVREACAARGLALAGPFWEVYDHAAADPELSRTDVVYLLERSMV